MKRFVFCDTFRYKELSFSAPPLSRGVPPYGVRTFLFSVPCGAEATVRHQQKHTGKPWSFKRVSRGNGSTNQLSDRGEVKNVPESRSCMQDKATYCRTRD